MTNEIIAGLFASVNVGFIAVRGRHLQTEPRVNGSQDYRHRGKEAFDMTGTTLPDLEVPINEALFAGALDPMSLRFQIVEYDKSSGELLSGPCDNIGFREAIETTAGLIGARRDSHFCLQPVCFVQ